MSAYQIFTLPAQQALDASANVLSGAKLNFFLTGTSTPTNAFTDSTLLTPAANPLTADAGGVFDQFFLDPAVTYRIVLKTAAGATLKTWDPANERPVSLDFIVALLAATPTALAIYPRTTEEIAASVTPSNYTYPAGDLRRYGAAIDGSTDDRTALNSAYAQFKQGGPAPFWEGSCYVSKNGANDFALQWDGDVVLDGKGHASLVGDGLNNYTLLYCNGSSKKVDIRGLTFDCKKSSPDRPSDNADIGLRIQGSFTSVNVEECIFQNYNEDGIYFRSDITIGASIHHNKFTNGARSAVSIAKGQYVDVSDNQAVNIQLQPFNVQAVDINTVCRQISIDRNRIIGGGYDTHAVFDRCAIFIAHVNGAASSVMGQYSVRNNVIKAFGATWPGSPGLFAFGVEVREVTDAIISGNEVTGCTMGAGLFSYLSIRCAFIGNIASGNDKGLWFNKCTDLSEIGNHSLGNVTYNYDYHGPDGATTYLQADGLSMLLARGSVSYAAGTPAMIAGDQFNVASLTDLGVGDCQVNFTRAPSNANYSVNATFRSHSGTQGLIESASKGTSSFRIVTFSAGAASDQNFDFEVRGTGPLVNLPP